MKDKFIENGIEYVRQGDYYIPNLTVPDEKEYNIGKYGRLRRTFLKEHHNWLYSTMLMQGTLLKHLAEIDEICNSTLKDMMSKMAEREGVTEQLKATNQMLWVQKVNNIHNCAEEFIMKEYVYGGFEE
ncbi:MAG: TnpV protein [Eubacteriales bacterium]|nr:TnpV protein [Eubacteriales bacterium]